MASNRWVAIDPDILTHPLVGAGQSVAPADPNRGAFSRMEAWVWIICNASFADHAVYNRGRKMTLKRGDLLGAWAFLAHTFNWSAKTVRVWVEKLVEDHMLERRASEAQRSVNADQIVSDETAYGNQATILSIVNYYRFQFDGDNEGQARGNQKGKQEGNQKGKQSAELTASKLADKYILQPQQGQAPGQAERQPKGQHITRDTITTVGVTNNPLPETSSGKVSAPTNGAPPLTPPLSGEGKPKRKRRATLYSEAFEVFWIGYPDRLYNSKPKAFEEWDRLGEPDQNAVIASLPGFNAFCRKNATYRCVHAERYIRDRKWESHAAPAGGAPWWKDPAQIAQLTRDRWQAGIDRYANGVWSVKELGPPPGHPECIVPHDIQNELALTEKYDARGFARSGH